MGLDNFRAQIVAHFIGAIIVIIIGVAVVLPVLNEVTKQLPPEYQSFGQFIPIMVLVVMIISILVTVSGLFSSDEPVDELEDDELPDEPPAEQTKKARKNAYEILAERYARGEISDEEYTDKMARL